MPSIDLSPPPRTGQDDVDRWLQRLYQQVVNLSPKRKTWTPVLTCDTVGDLSVSYTIHQGAYWTIGTLVVALFRISTSAFSYTTATGTVRVTGLPLTSANISNEIDTGGAVIWGGVTKANFGDVAPTVPANDNRIALSISGSGQAPANLAITDFPTGGSVVLRGFVLYPTA